MMFTVFLNNCFQTHTIDDNTLVYGDLQLLILLALPKSHHLYYLYRVLFLSIKYYCKFAKCYTLCNRLND